MKQSVYNLFFRGLTLLSKFLFVFFLGKFAISESELGEYGLIVASLAMLVYILGFDFYIFNTRDIIEDKSNSLHKIFNQFVFHLFGYILIIPIGLTIIISFKLIANQYYYVLPALLITEHLGQELYRLFTTYEKSVEANIFLFFRSGLWVWIAFYDFFILENMMDLSKYIEYWLMFSFTSLLLSTMYFKIYILSASDSFQKVTIDFSWIRQGIRTSGVFFLGSLSFQVIQFSDRFMIDHFYSKKDVGIYTLYSQFANVLEVFIFTGVSMVYYPKLLKAIHNAEIYNKVIHTFKRKLLILAIALICVFYMAIPKILAFMEKESYLEYIGSFYILLGAAFIFTQSHAAHYDLFVKKRDTLLLWIAVTGAIINIFLNIFLIPSYGIRGAAIATLCSYIFIFLTKLFLNRRIILNQ